MTFVDERLLGSARARETQIDTGIAFSQALTVDRAMHEAARELRQVLACEAVAVSLVEPGAEAPRLVHVAGFEQEPAELEARLRPVWREALETGVLVARDGEQGDEATVRMVFGDVRGAITVAGGLADSQHEREEMRRILETVALQAAAAVARSGLVGRAIRKSRLEAVAEVTAGVAHELRNPLFGISSAAQLLRYRVREDPVIEKNIGRILREVERLNGLVNAMLEYGRPAPIRLAPGDPDEIWEDVLEVQRGLLESKALLLRHAAATPRATCNVDAAQLAQVFVNVLVNAVDAAPEGTDLTLTSSVLANGSWRCRLQNLGPAIPLEVLPRVFEIFVSTKPGGTGIGLALAQRIVEEHGGTIAIESAPEPGTTLTITLPPAAA